jgi:O-antigen/teichoic acid export membrane protein
MSIPLFIYALLTWIISYVDRFIILGVLKDPVLVGIFDFGVKVVLAIDLIMTGLVNTVNPKVYSIWKRENLTGSSAEVNRYYSGLTAFFMIMIPLFVLAAPVVIPWFIHKEIYYRSFGFIAILAAGYMTRVWFYMFLAPIMFFKKSSVLPGVFFFAALFEIGMALLLVRYFGLAGAVWTFFLVKPVQAALLYRESRKFFDFRFNKMKIIGLPLVFMAVVLLTEVLLPEPFRIFGRLFQLLVSVVLVWIAYRKELIPLLTERRFR